MAPASMPFISWDSKTATGSSAPLVLQGVDQAEPVAALGADREQLVQGDHRHERDLVEDLVQLVGGDAELLGHLGVGGAAMEAVLQGDVGLLDLPGLEPDRPGDPVLVQEAPPLGRA